MSDTFLFRLKRADTPFFRFLKKLVWSVRSANLPLPRIVFPVLRLILLIQQSLGRLARWFLTYFYIEPLFRSRCEKVGRRFGLSRLPFLVGPTKIYIGDDVNFFGKVDIISGHILPDPKLILKDRVDIGHNVVFVVNREIVIEEDVNVASGVRFMDTDAHPRDAADRVADLPPPPEEIKPVRVGRYAWIGQNSFILKGVTIGEGAIIGVNSVVVTDVPAYSVAMGNPARVVVKNTNKAAAAPDAASVGAPR